MRLILFILLLSTACGVQDPFKLDKPHPADDSLIENFQKHEADFNKLVGMSNEDSKVIRIAPTFTRLENNWAWPRPDSELGFSKQRWDEYRVLFDKLGLQDGISRESDSTGPVIFLTAFSKGMVNRGSSKGYAYSDHELKPVFPSLDQNPSELRKGERHGVVFRQIKSHWYLSYDW